jgi:hypothetical protein
MKYYAPGYWLIGLKASVLAVLLACFIISAPASAQSDVDEASEGRHEISLLIGHMHIAESVEGGGKTWHTLPSWELNYSYFIHPQWLVGLHNDIILEEFLIETTRGEVVERSYPIGMVATVGYLPVHYLTLLLGTGVELAHEEQFAMIRLGIEPTLKFNTKWEMLINLSYDIKIDAYDSWSLSAGIARRF